MKNRDRALAAENALSVFTDEMYGGKTPAKLHPEDLETAVYDLISDLLHYANLRGLSAEKVLANAQRQYEYEVPFGPDTETD